MGSWIDYPSSGLATLTHYTLPTDYIASCGCTPASTHYPTAALSQMAFGSSTAYGQSLLFQPNSSHPTLPRPCMWSMLHTNSPESGDCEPPIPSRPKIHHRESHRFMPLYPRRLVRCNRRQAKLVRLFRVTSSRLVSRLLVRAHTLISILLTPLTLSPMTFFHQTNLYTVTRSPDNL
jgi:hypothetical protein